MKKGLKMEMIRVLKEMPSFVSIDGRNYRLYREDIVMLPEANADTLCRKGYAVKIHYGRSMREECEER